MSINYSPLKLTNENINNNYISNTIPNEDQTSTFTNFNHFSSFNNQKITNCNYNIDSNELINSFKIIQSNSFNNDDKNEIINQLRKEYDSRIINLHNNIKKVISKLENDDVLASMRDDMDSANTPLIDSRIKEIIDENLYKEKENIIEKLLYENANLKTQLKILIQNNNNNNGNNLLNSHQQLQIKNLEKVINELNINIDSYTIEINNKNLELSNLQKQYNIISNELIKLKQQQTQNSFLYESFGNFSEITQYKNKLIKANNEIERLNKVINVIEIDLNNTEEEKKQKNLEIEKLNKELTLLKNKDDNNINNEDFQEKYTEKYNEMKIEIDNLQKLLDEKKAEIELKEEKYKQVMSEMEKNLKIVSEEWSNKLENSKNNYEIIIKNLENKNQIEINNIVKESEIEIKELKEENEKLKLFKEKYKNKEKELMPIYQHEEIIKEKIKEMNNILNKELNNKSDEL